MNDVNQDKKAFQAHTPYHEVAGGNSDDKEQASNEPSEAPSDYCTR